MVRYAYVKYASTDWSYRYLVTAPDAATLDTWWRKTSEKYDDYKRLSPDFYTYVKVNPHQTVPDMTDRMMFTLLNDRDGRQLSIFPQKDRTDHVSDKTFYIRAKNNPKLYWTEYSNGYIYASEKSRTRFRIRIDGEKDGSSKVMIGEDNIVISSAKNSNRQLGVSDQGQIYLGGHSCRMRFSDFKDLFLAEVGVDGMDMSGDAAITKMNNAAGEEWELVS